MAATKEPRGGIEEKLQHLRTLIFFSLEETAMMSPTGRLFCVCVTVCLSAWTDIALISTDSFVVNRDGQASEWSMLSDLQKHYSEPIKEKV